MKKFLEIFKDDFKPRFDGDNGSNPSGYQKHEDYGGRRMTLIDKVVIGLMVIILIAAPLYISGI